MVYQGEYAHRDYLDPHFDGATSSPIARFRPDDAGWKLAIAVAKALGEG